MSSIKMSMNELSYLLKRSFEGLGYCQADYEDAAATVIWLESHGLSGFATVNAAWPRLTAQLGNDVLLTDTHGAVKVIDGGAASILILGRLLVEFTMAEAATGLGRVACLDVRDRLAILPSLTVCARSHIAALAYWQDGRHLHTAIVEADQTCPDYQVTTGENDIGLKDNALYLACCNDANELHKLTAALSSQLNATGNKRHVAPSTMKRSRRESLLNGLSVDTNLLQTLSASAERVLVESTEQSRRGAGE